MPLIELSRFYPATPDETFEALGWAAQELAHLRSEDDFSRAVTFFTKTSTWASGANVSAYVVPQDGGCTIRVEGQAKMRSQVKANNAAHKQIVAVLDRVSTLIPERRQH